MTQSKRGFWQSMDPWLIEFIGRGGRLENVLYNEPLDAIDRSTTGDWIRTAIEVLKTAHSNDALPQGAVDPAQSSLRAAVFTVLEGFTLPHDVRKILETAYYSTPSPPSIPVMLYKSTA